MYNSECRHVFGTKQFLRQSLERLSASITGELYITDIIADA